MDDSEVDHLQCWSCAERGGHTSTVGIFRRATAPWKASGQPELWGAAESLTGLFVVRILVQKLVRTHLIGTESVSTPAFASNGLRGWVVSTRTVDAAGQTISAKTAENLITTACNITRAPQDVDGALADRAPRIGIHDIDIR